MPIDPAQFEAAKNGNGNHSQIKFLNLNPYDQLTVRKNTILHVAVKYGNKIAAQQIVDIHPWLVHETNLSGDTPLHIAARLGHSSLVKLIVMCLKNDPGQQGKFPLRALNERNHTALHDAVKNGHCGVVNLLIEEDPGLVHINNDSHESPLFMAVDRGFYNVADSILSYISDWSANYGSGRDNMTVMHAVAFGLSFQSTITCQELTRKLVEKCDAEILEVKDKFGRTALHYAAYVGNVRVVELFLDKNRFLAYIKDDKGMSAMHISAMKGHIGVINELVKHCPDVCELLDDNNQTPLHVAVRSGRQETAWNFLYGRDCFDGIMLNEEDKEGNTPLHVAALSGHLEILRMLAEDPRVQRKAINHMGMTAADIIPSSTSLPIFDKHSMVHRLAKLGEKERLEKTLDDEITRASLLHECHPPQSSRITNTNTKEDRNNNKNKSWDKNLVEVNLLVATIIASITFAAAMTMPGGYNSSDGMASLRRKLFFKLFVMFDSVAFGFAAASVIIHFLFVSFSKMFGSNVVYPFKTIMLLTYLSVVCTVFAFSTAIQAILEHTDTPISLPTASAFLCCFIPVLIYFISMYCHILAYYVMCTRMYIKASLNRMINCV